MDYLEDLRCLREKIKYNKDKKAYDKESASKTFIEECLLEYLRDKSFLSVDGYKSDFILEEEKILNLIEKIAVWYEFRYPTDDMDLSKVDIMKDIKDLYDSLSIEERMYLYETPYPEIVYIDDKNKFYKPHFHLSENGIVIDADELGPDICNMNFKGKSLRTAYDMLVGRNPEYFHSKELNYVLNTYENLNILHIFVKLAVIYRIIDRGNVGIGARRAYIFGESFNISGSIKYGVDLTDPRLEEFLNTYIDGGGSLDTECLLNYKTRLNDNMHKTTIGEVLTKYFKDNKRLNKNCKNNQGD